MSLKRTWPVVLFYQTVSELQVAHVVVDGSAGGIHSIHYVCGNHDPAETRECCIWRLVCLWRSAMAMSKVCTCRRDSLCASLWCRHHRWSASGNSCRWRGGCAAIQNLSHSYSPRWSHPAAGCPVEQVQCLSFVPFPAQVYFYGLSSVNCDVFCEVCKERHSRSYSIGGGHQLPRRRGRWFPSQRCSERCAGESRQSCPQLHNKLWRKMGNQWSY